MHLREVTEDIMFGGMTGSTLFFCNTKTKGSLILAGATNNPDE